MFCTDYKGVYGRGRGVWAALFNLFRLRLPCLPFLILIYTNWVFYFCLILLLCLGSSFLGLEIN